LDALIPEDSVIRYERLRARMICDGQSSGSQGAAMLIHRGMLVWIRSREGGGATRGSAVRFKSDSEPLPADLQSMVVSLLSQMILENHQRRRAYDDVPGKGDHHASQA
jgi:hypothetical protein